MSRPWLVACGLAIVLPGSSARAQSPTPLVSLVWDNTAAPACIDQAHLQSAVEARLQRPLFRPGTQPQFVIRGQAGGSSGAWQAVLRVWDDGGRYVGDREIRSEAPTCDQLGDALGLVLAMIIESPREHVSLHLPPPPPQPSASLAPLPAPAARVPAAPPPRLWHLDSSASATAGWGVLPGAAFGWRLTSSAANDSTRAFAFLGAWNETRTVTHDVTIRAAAWQAGLGWCPWSWGKGIVQLEPCAALSGGQVAGRGQGLDVTRSARPWFAHAEVGAALSLHAQRHVFVRLGAMAAIGVVRARFFYDRADGSPQQLWKAPEISPRFDLGIGLRLP